MIGDHDDIYKHIDAKAETPKTHNVSRSSYHIANQIEHPSNHKHTCQCQHLISLNGRLIGPLIEK